MKPNASSILCILVFYIIVVSHLSIVFVKVFLACEEVIQVSYLTGMGREISRDTISQYHTNQCITNECLMQSLYLAIIYY